MEYHEETIICPKCGKVQVAKVEHTAPFYSYVHDCEECGYTILESEWEHPNDHEGLDEAAEEHLDATIFAMWELYSKPIDAGFPRVAIMLLQTFDEVCRYFYKLDKSKTFNPNIEWHKIDEHPKQWQNLVLLCKSGKVLFNGQYDGNAFTVWDDENGIWRPPKNEIVVGWMLQKEVEEYLKQLNHF